MSWDRIIIDGFQWFLLGILVYRSAAVREKIERLEQFQRLQPRLGRQWDAQRMLEAWEFERDQEAAAQPGSGYADTAEGWDSGGDQGPLPDDGRLPYSGGVA